MDAATGTMSNLSVSPRPAQRPLEASIRRVEAPAAAQGDAGSGGGIEDRAARRLTATRSIDIDVDTGSLVFRMIDAANGDVTSQTPDEARLKLRAYVDAFQARAEPTLERMA